MSDILIKIDDAAKLLGISPSTVKSYSQSLEAKGYTFARGNKKEYLFSHENIELFRKVLRLKKEMSVDQAMVQAVMETGDISDLTDISEVPSNEVLSPQTFLKAMSDISKDMSGISVELKEIKTSNKELLDQNNELQKQNKDLANEVEALKVQALREVMENRKSLNEMKEELLLAIQEQAASKKKWWEFWK